MAENKSRQSSFARKDEIIIEKYIEIITENLKQCNQRYHHFLYLFLILSIVFYFLCALETAEISLLSASIKIPKDFILIFAPLTLSYIFHCFMNFISLEVIYENELKNIFKNFNNSEIELKFCLIEFVHLIAWAGIVRDIYNKDSLTFRYMNFFIGLIHGIATIIIPPLVIVYFFWKGMSFVGSLWLILPYGVSFFFIIYSIYEFITSGSITLDSLKQSKFSTHQ